MPRSSCIRFQSTFSMQRVTVQMLLLLLMFGISTHIFREEGDVAGHRRPTPHRKFQSTPSARRATKSVLRQFGGQEISIPALREEGDVPVRLSKRPSW